MTATLTYNILHGSTLSPWSIAGLPFRRAATRKTAAAAGTLLGQVATSGAPDDIVVFLNHVPDLQAI